MKTKVCSGTHGCGHELPLDEFNSYFDKRWNKTYPLAMCKDCQKILAKVKNKKYRQKNPKKTKENDRKYRERYKSLTRVRNREKIHADNLTDKYIKSVFRRVHNLNNPTSDQIEIKRIVIRIKRLIKAERNE